MIEKMGKTIDRVLESIASTILFPPILMSTYVAVAAYLFYSNYYLILLYAIWYFVSRNYGSQGGRHIQLLRNLPIWNYYVNYFPIHLIKTAELDPSKNYLCGFHPHGYFAGFTTNFLTEATGFSLKFPNLKPWTLVHRASFKIPIHREVVLALGGRDVARESIQWLLTKEGVGNMVVLIPGGVQEMCFTEQKKFKLKLESRKGFIRLAMETGSSLVPILSFGENDIYHVPERNTWIGKIRAWYHERTKKPLAAFYGPNKCLPTLPFRIPINTVVGSPINVQQTKDPTDDEICRLHKTYVDKLRELYDEYKVGFGNGNIELEIG